MGCEEGLTMMQAIAIYNTILASLRPAVVEQSGAICIVSRRVLSVFPHPPYW